MRKARVVTVLMAVALLSALAFAAAPIAAMPGWSKDTSGVVPITEQQRDQIQNLHRAYRAAIANLDWSVSENGHASETMQQARELRIALRAEILDVIHRDGQAAQSAGCPYGGKAQPVRVDRDTDTLYL